MPYYYYYLSVTLTFTQLLLLFVAETRDGISYEEKRSWKPGTKMATNTGRSCDKTERLTAVLQ